MKRYELYPDGVSTKDVFRPKFCYADGHLKEDLNGDYFYMESSAVEIAKEKNPKIPNYAYAKHGKYPCHFNGKNATLYVKGSGFHTEGYACYDDDKDAIKRIFNLLGVTIYSFIPLM